MRQDQARVSFSTLECDPLNLMDRFHRESIYIAKEEISICNHYFHITITILQNS